MISITWHKRAVRTVLALIWIGAHVPVLSMVRQPRSLHKLLPRDIWNNIACLLPAHELFLVHTLMRTLELTPENYNHIIRAFIAVLIKRDKYTHEKNIYSLIQRYFNTTASQALNPAILRKNIRKQLNQVSQLAAYTPMIHNANHIALAQQLYKDFAHVNRLARSPEHLYLLRQGERQQLMATVNLEEAILRSYIERIAKTVRSKRYYGAGLMHYVKPRKVYIGGVLITSIVLGLIGTIILYNNCPYPNIPDRCIHNLLQGQGLDLSCADAFTDYNYAIKNKVEGYAFTFYSIALSLLICVWTLIGWKRSAHYPNPKHNRLLLMKNNLEQQAVTLHNLLNS